MTCYEVGVEMALNAEPTISKLPYETDARQQPVGKVLGRLQTGFGFLKSTIKSLFQRVAGKSGPHLKKGNSGRLAASSIGAMVVYVVGAGLSYISQMLIARTIGANSFGIYAYVFAWVTMLGYLSTLGFHVSLLRFIPAYRSKENWQSISGISQYSQRGAAIVGLGVVAIGSAILLANRNVLEPELTLTFFIGLLTVPIISQHLISASLVRSYGGIVQALAPERVGRDVVLMIAVGLAAWSGMFALSAQMAMSAALVSAVATLILLRVFLRPLKPVAVDAVPPVYAVKDWLKPALPVMFIVIADSLMSRSGVIALGMNGNTLDAGIFAVALSMSLLAGMPRMAVAAAFAPKVSDLYARGDRDGLQTLAVRASLLSFIGALGIALPLLFFNGPLLGLFGSSFVAGAPIVIILVIGQLFAAACGPQQHLITMTGNERSAATIMMLCAIVNLAACVFAIKAFNNTGVAVAMSATLVVWNIAMAIYIYLRLNLLPGLMCARSFIHSKG